MSILTTSNKKLYIVYIHLVLHCKHCAANRTQTGTYGTAIRLNTPKKYVKRSGLCQVWDEIL